MRVGLIGAAILLAATAHGGIEHTMLHGVSVGRVRANVGPDAVPGLTEAQLQGMAESSLRESGVPLNPKAEPAFFIGATVVTRLPGACFVHLEARLIEAAKLDRNGQAVDASSWRGGSDVATNSLDQCATMASKAAKEVVADFVEHYRAMNPAPNRR